MSAKDTQIGGSHYKDLAIQPVQYNQKNNLGYCEGSVVKYVTRWRDKGGVQDLEKAKHFLDLLIEMESPGEEPKEVPDICEQLIDMENRSLERFLGNPVSCPDPLGKHSKPQDADSKDADLRKRYFEGINFAATDPRQARILDLEGKINRQKAEIRRMQLAAERHNREAEEREREEEEQQKEVDQGPLIKAINKLIELGYLFGGISGDSVLMDNKPLETIAVRQHGKFTVRVKGCDSKIIWIKSIDEISNFCQYLQSESLGDCSDLVEPSTHD